MNRPPLWLALVLVTVGCTEPERATPVPTPEPKPAAMPAAPVVAIIPAPAPIATVTTPPPVDFAAVLATHPDDRRGALTAEVRRLLAVTRPDEALRGAALLTAEPNATPGDHLLLARCQFEAGKPADAEATLGALEQTGLLDAAGEGGFAEAEGLHARILASRGDGPGLVRGLWLAGARARSRAGGDLQADCLRIAGGYRLRIRLPDQPHRIALFWRDHEEAGVLAVAQTRLPMSGAWSVDLTWDGEPPRGEVLALALPLASTVPSLLTALPPMPVDQVAAEETRRPWRAVVQALGAHPADGAAVVRCPAE